MLNATRLVGDADLDRQLHQFRWRIGITIVESIA
jgi:hypothetical protein